MILFFFLAAAAIHGTVSDGQKHPVEAAVVTLQQKSGTLILKMETDAHGEFRFPQIVAGAYTVRAEKKGSGEAVAGPFDLHSNDDKQVDLILNAAPDFFDEPQFVVAGVTDASAHGGHGSDTLVRSADSLAQATASLTNERVQKQADALEAERRDERAAGQDPSEPNLFNWGSELLLHRAYEPAIQVFSKGVRLHPASTRMLLGLAASLYANGAYDQAAQRFFEACDKNPNDAEPYLFLGKVQTVAITALPGYAERMARFSKLQPTNPWAQYYYAVSLWKQRQHPEQVPTLLAKAIELDPNMAAAYLQLGILHFDQNNFTQASVDLRKAIQANPSLEEAHYRLAQTYRRLGDDTAARDELAIYDRLSKESAQDAERRRNELGQFVYELRKPRQ